MLILKFIITIYRQFKYAYVKFLMYFFGEYVYVYNTLRYFGGDSW